MSSIQPASFATHTCTPQRLAYAPLWAAAAKRSIDLLAAVFGQLILSPIFLALALLVKLQDGGRVFYRRRVVGPHGSFDAFKFRSMRPDADAVLERNASLRAT